MQTPLVSVISPTYNHQAYIIECIKSVQAQTYPHWEMLIVNDGSTDATSALVRDYIAASGDTRVKLFDQQNVGIHRLGETYNFALGKSQGKYVAILEGDDLWEPEKLSRQVKVMEEQNDVVLSWGMAHSVKDDLSVIYGSHPMIDGPEEKYFFNTPPGDILNLLYFENYLAALTIVMRKETLLQVGGFIQSHNLPLVDLPTILALSLKGRFHFDKFLYGQWRIFANQVTKTYPVQIIKGRYALSLDHIKQLPPEVKSLVKVKEAELHAYFNRIILIAYARSGRYKLMRHDYKGARTDYRHAMLFRGISQPMWRVRAAVGWVMSLFHMDVEWLAKLIGRRSYK